MKRRCAKEALKYIRDNMTIGLGGGSTIGYLISYIKESELNVKVVTPSFKTASLCIENGLQVVPTWSVSNIDIAFDGCDEVDEELNALKSGGGIHTKEKIIASMSREYILLVDESKFVRELEFNHPVVLEIIPESKGYVELIIRDLGGETKMRSSEAKDGITITDNGLFLIDAFFDKNKISSIEKLNQDLNSIVGIVDTSLFYNIATKVIVASNEEIKVIERKVN